MSDHGAGEPEGTEGSVNLPAQAGQERLGEPVVAARPVRGQRQR